LGPSAITNGSLGYYVNIRSSVIKNFPLPGKIEEEIYLSRGGEGTSPPSNGLNFKSNSNKDFLMKTFDQYLVNKGYKRLEEYVSDNEMYYEREKISTVDIVFQTTREGINGIYINESYD